MTPEGTPTLNSVCLFIEDCLHATAPIQGEGFPLIRTPNIGKGRLNLEGVHRISPDTYETWTRRATPEAGDLILAREAPAGNVAVVREGEIVALGQRTVHLRPDCDQVDPEYLCYFLLTPRMQGALLAGETGATAKHINMKDIRRLPLPGMHSRKVQSKIGRMIGVYDDMIENNRRRIKLLEEAARLIYREWFVHLRFPGHKLGLIKNGVPEGWSLRPFSEIANFLNGYAFKPSELTDQGMPVIKIPELKDGVTSKTPYNSGEQIPERFIVEDGDLLFSWSGTLAVNFWIGKSGLLNQHLFKVTPRTDGMKGFTYLSLIAALASFDNETTGATMKHIRRSALDTTRTLVGPENLMSEFSAFVEPLFEQVRILRKQNISLIQARNLLLPRLMSGEIEV